MFNRILKTGRGTAIVGLFMLATAGTAAAEQTTHSAAAQSARGDITKTLGFVPGFLSVMPDAALPGAWEELKGLQLNPNTAISGRTKELIGLGVAAQIPCKYCIYAHTEFAKLNGAKDAEIGEAVALAGMARHWSTFMYGTQIDAAQARADVERIVQNAKKPPPAGPAVKVVDGKTALRDIERTLGFVPEFLRRVPDSALPGAWREMKDLKLNPNTHLSAKQKALVALAVVSQVPSEPCIAAETEFAKLAGATPREIGEAIGMAAVTRNMSTVLNGQQVDEDAFKTDVDRLVTGAKGAQKRASLPQRGTGR